MDETAYKYLVSKPKLVNFIRYNPEWYRYLARDPNRVYELEEASKFFYGKTLSQRLDKVTNQIQMVHMLIQFSGIMKD